jgi:hypothetical protein
MSDEREIFEVDFTGLQRAADDICAALDRARQQRDRYRRALKHIADWHPGDVTTQRMMSDLAREALTEDSKHGST